MKPALPDGVAGIVLSPDDRYLVASSVSDPMDKIYDLAGGPPRPIRGLKKGRVCSGMGTWSLAAICGRP